MLALQLSRNLIDVSQVHSLFTTYYNMCII